MNLVLRILLCLSVITVVCSHGPGSVDTHHGYAPPSHGQGYHRQPSNYRHGGYPVRGGNHHHYYYGTVYKHIHGQEEQSGHHNTPSRGESMPVDVEQNEPKDREHEVSGSCDCQKGDNSKKTWTFMVGDNYGAWEYIDHQGYIQGFHVDLIQAVCKKAGKICFHILDTYHNCWNTRGLMEKPGQGLMDQWYDGCIGLSISPERKNSFNFSVPFAPNSRAAIHYMLEKLPHNPRNLTGRRIGFIDGWAVGQKCLGRQLDLIGNQPKDYYPVSYDSHEEMTLDLQMGTLDALLTVDIFDAQKLRLLGMVAIDPWFNCTVGGPSMMARYDSDVVGWWNDNFLQLKADGEYAELCKEALTKHGHRGKIDCIAKDD